MYNALRCQCEQEYNNFMNYDLFTKIFEQLSNSKHSQFGIVAIIRAILFVVNKEIWKTFLKFRLIVLKRGAIKEREITADSELNIDKFYRSKCWSHM